MKLKHFAILTIAFIVGWFLSSVTFGQITGPASVQSGTLAIFETDQKADWSITPTSKSTGMFFADSSGTRIFFASPVAGEYEVICATAENDEPKLYTFVFVNGDGKITPEPPTPPEPKPQTFTDWIKANIPVDATQAELSGISGWFESVSARIKQGTIRTVDQAFASVRTNAQRYSSWQEFLEKLSKREELQTEDVKKLGETFAEIAEGMKNETSAERRMQNAELKSENDSTLCETGDCPVPSKPVKPQTTSRRRW